MDKLTQFGSKRRTTQDRLNRLLIMFIKQKLTYHINIDDTTIKNINFLGKKNGTLELR